jgi:hypothetical protein
MPTRCVESAGFRACLWKKSKLDNRDAKHSGHRQQQIEKLIRVKTELRRAMNSASSRSISEIHDLVRRVDQILE